jgi:pectate lyase
MKHVTGPFLLALAVAVFPALADAKVLIAPCKPGRYDSNPSSLGADGWAAVDGPVTGGCGAAPTRIFDVYNRAQLVDALNRQVGNALPEVPGRPSDTPKIVYVHGPIDLNVDDDNQPLREEDYMRRCGWTEHATYYDPVTQDQAGAGGFFGAWAAYDPNLWIANRRSPTTGTTPVRPLERRVCFQRMQAERVVVDVGSNTRLSARQRREIVNGNLRLGFINQNDPDSRPIARRTSSSQHHLRDAFDMFSVGSGTLQHYHHEHEWLPGDLRRRDRFRAASLHGARRSLEPEYDSISAMNAERVWVDHNTFHGRARTTSSIRRRSTPFNSRPRRSSRRPGRRHVARHQGNDLEQRVPPARQDQPARRQRHRRHRPGLRTGQD